MPRDIVKILMQLKYNKVCSLSTIIKENHLNNTDKEVPFTFLILSKKNTCIFTLSFSAEKGIISHLL